jgi:hypothetical protein
MVILIFSEIPVVYLQRNPINNKDSKSGEKHGAKNGVF